MGLFVLRYRNIYITYFLTNSGHMSPYGMLYGGSSIACSVPQSLFVPIAELNNLANMFRKCICDTGSSGVPVFSAPLFFPRFCHLLLTGVQLFLFSWKRREAPHNIYGKYTIKRYAFSFFILNRKYLSQYNTHV